MMPGILEHNEAWSQADRTNEYIEKFRSPLSRRRISSMKSVATGMAATSECQCVTGRMVIGKFARNFCDIPNRGSGS